jgi:predicted nucleic acid-binding protein
VPGSGPITFETQKGALSIAEKHGHSIYDALVISAALEAGCKTLFSEDLREGQIIDQQLTSKSVSVTIGRVP